MKPLVACYGNSGRGGADDADFVRMGGLRSAFGLRQLGQPLLGGGCMGCSV